MEIKVDKIDLRFSVLTMLIVLAVFSRIVPHIPNFSPLGAIGLFGAAHFKKKWQAFTIPLAAVWISDLFLNNVIHPEYYQKFTLFYDGFYWQYGSYIMVTLGGLFILKKFSPGRLIAASLFSSLLFFTVTNFGCWPGSTHYEQNLAGLLTCYTAGIPFIKGTILGDICYSAVMFGSFYLLEQKYPQIKTANS